MKRSQNQYFQKLKPPVLVLMAIVSLATFLFARSYLKASLFTTTTVIFFILIFEAKIKKLLKVETTGVVFLIILTAVIGFGWTFLSALLSNPTVSGITPIAILYLFVMAIVVILNPLPVVLNALFVVCLTAYNTTLIYISSVQTNHDLVDGTLILLGWHVFGIYTHNSCKKTAQRASYLVCKQKELIQKGELLKKEALEKDLRLAQEIQDSISQPTEISSDSGIVGILYQKKQGFLGGDWTGSFRDRYGNLFIVMADITGKGIPAALVVHALQALWIAAISDDSAFNPVSWVHEVNKTMISLGRNWPQTLSLGIIMIEGNKLSYISAGHIPLYVLVEKDDEIVLKTIPSRGNLLGVSQDLKLVVKSIDAQSLNLRWILGGTDGVFISGTRLSPREAANIIKILKNSGAEELLEKDSDDDKILLLLEKNASYNSYYKTKT